ncbi:MAG TPA: futalosine hydrolase [Dissulfurispiraceae bacterium]|nr:futalosine hydrolase [Dissulfurispiraceae bacterium]
MSRTAFIVSTALEGKSVARCLAHKRAGEVAGVSFLSGRIAEGARSGSIILCVSGIGKANAARAATLLIMLYRPDRIINFGVGGAYPSSGFGIGDIVVADSEHYGDEGLQTAAEFRDMRLLGFPLLRKEAEPLYNSFPLHVPRGLRQEVRAGGFVTVSTCTGTRAAGMKIEHHWSAVCENMEGAAIAHVGAAHDIPVTEFRGISNVIEDRTGAPLSKEDVLRAAGRAEEFLLENWHRGLFE